MPNRLANSASPYLLQHAENPVDWWEWSPEAFAEAKRLNRPVLLSIGYAACHWCHVMAHESFEDEAVAAVMNEHVVSIKVDREERPDVDQIYMAALHALGQQGGWPLTMFLTPDGEPFWGGTYFPKKAQYGRPGFPDVVRTVAEVFAKEPETVAQNRTAIAERLKPKAPPAGVAFGAAELDDLARRIADVFDPQNGGFQGAPKFPQPGVLELLLRASRRAGQPELAAPVALTLRQMAKGGVHDQVGGGFARYSVDERWLVPHFEKMLYDNAQLLPLLADAGSAAADAWMLDAAHGIIDWAAREMRVEDAFASSLDADSEGVEGRFYVWRPQELAEALDPADAAFAAESLGISPSGNWEGVSIPNRLHESDGAPVDEERLRRVKDRMLAYREGRVRPGRDDKILADWNGLMIAALAETASALRRPDALALARAAFDAVLSRMAREDRLGHAWRQGRLVFPGFATDHGAMALAGMALAGATGEQAYRDLAARWIDAAWDNYRNPNGPGFAMDADDAPQLVVRPEALLDEALPSGTALLLNAALRLAAFDADDERLARLDGELAALLGRMAQNPIGHAGLLNALDMRMRLASIVVVGDDEVADALHQEALALPWTERVVRRAPTPAALPERHPVRAARLTGSAAFVCAGARCSAPVNEASRLATTVAETVGS